MVVDILWSPYLGEIPNGPLSWSKKRVGVSQEKSCVRILRLSAALSSFVTRNAASVLRWANLNLISRVKSVTTHVKWSGNVDTRENDICTWFRGKVISNMMRVSLENRHKRLPSKSEGTLPNVRIHVYRTISDMLHDMQNLIHT
jgi:hypothetical protein